MFTAGPEGGTLIREIVNQVFVLPSYPDGTPVKADMTIHASGNPDQHVATDDAGIAMIRITPSGERESLWAYRPGSNFSAKISKSTKVRM
jgi:hypothetical protein